MRARSAKHAAAMKGERMRYMRPLGYTSDVFPAKFRGSCACCAGRYRVGEPVCFYEGFDKPIAAACADKLAKARQLAALPKCGCARPADHDNGTCLECAFTCRSMFGLWPADVTRDTPLALELATVEGR